MIASLKSKRNDLGEVSFSANFVASGLVAKRNTGCRNGVETYIAVTLSKAIDRTCHLVLGVSMQ